MLLALVLGGCSIGGSGDDDDPTATSAADAPTVTTEATVKSATPTTAASPTATEPAASPTAAATNTPAATSTPSPTPSPTATVPPTPEPTQALEGINRFSPLTLTNYALRAEFDVVSVPGLDNQHTAFNILQSAGDNYQVQATTDTGTFETWVVGEDTYIRQANGSIIELPAGVDTALFSPELLVQTMPAPTAGMGVLPRGNGTAGERAVRLYVVPADAYLAALGVDPGVEADELNGVIHLWVDAEWGIPVRQAGSVTWTTADGAEASISINWEMTSIGSTAPIVAPVEATS